MPRKAVYLDFVPLVNYYGLNFFFYGQANDVYRVKTLPG